MTLAMQAQQALNDRKAAIQAAEDRRKADAEIKVNVYFNGFKKDFTAEVMRLSKLGYAGFKVKGDYLRSQEWCVQSLIAEWLKSEGITIFLNDQSFMGRDSDGSLDWVEVKHTTVSWATGPILNDNLDKPYDSDW